MGEEGGGEGGGEGGVGGRRKWGKFNFFLVSWGWFCYACVMGGF